MNVILRNTGENATLKVGCTTKISYLLRLYTEENIDNCFEMQIRFRAVQNNSPKVGEPKCKIEPNGACKEEIMFVHTS